MSATNKNQSTPSFIILLVLLLVTAVGIQAWYLIDMKQTLNAMQAGQKMPVPADRYSASTDPDDMASTGSAAPGTQSGTDANAGAETGISITASTGEHNDESADRAVSDPIDDELAQQAPPENTQPENNSNTPDNPAATAPPAVMQRPDPRDYFSHRPSPSRTFPSRTPPSQTPPSQNWDPHEELLRMQRHMQRAFNDRYYRPDNRRSNPNYTDNKRRDFHYQFSQDFSVPEMDMRENQNEYIVLVNIPGADQKDISVNLEGQRLTVKGRQEYTKQQSNPEGNFVFSERRSGRFQRSITLAEPVEEKGMKTQVENGILRIIIPKKNTR